jgi:multiple sugar transport system ATP-binding protein
MDFDLLQDTLNSMAAISFTGISRKREATTVLEGISLDVSDGEFLTLLGPSGCGKSTLLKILAGLESQDAGSVTIGGKSVDGLRPKQRDVAMVFQSYALYPHMTVAGNMALPLRMRRLTFWQRLPLIGRALPRTALIQNEIETEVGNTAKLLGIDHLLARKPGQLSGGQRQRVAVGRAMVRHPAVFLMDEPLSNLDAKLRVQMRTEIKELHRRLGVTFIYVTHDQTEAMTLSDRVAVMLEGELLQVAPPQEIYADPDDRRVAELIGSPKINILQGIVREQGWVAVGDGAFAIDTTQPIGSALTLGIRPEALRLCEHGVRGSLQGSVRLVEHMGCDLWVHLDVPGIDEPVIARLPAERAPLVESGRLVSFGVAPERILLFGSDGKRIRRQATIAPPAFAPFRATAR